MSLRNLIREPVQIDGVDSWRLLDPDGQPIAAFSSFAKKIQDESFATRKRYCEVISRFLDFLFEIGILGKGAVTRAQVNEAIDHYIALLRDGEGITFGNKKGAALTFQPGDEARQQALRAVAKKLGIRPLAPNSWANTIAPLNIFLRLSSMLEQEAQEIAILRAKIDPSIVHQALVDSRPLIEALAGCNALSPQEIKNIKLASSLGSVIRFRGEELTRPRGLRAPKFRAGQRDTEVLDFPMEHFPALLEAAKNCRDKALWLLTAASGIRRSEALNLEWHQIDFEKQLVYVLDPDFKRYGRQIPETTRHQRFKGRSVSWTYLRMPYRQMFFEALSEYRKQEYVLPRDHNDYVFQFVDPTRRGRPYHEASDAALNESFTHAVKRANIPGPPMAPKYVWTQHSLRHAYGVFMFNDFFVPGNNTPGLTEAEVQMLMGHKSIASTRRYARQKEAALLNRLAQHDHILLGAVAASPSALLPSSNFERLMLSELSSDDAHDQ